MRYGKWSIFFSFFWKMTEVYISYWNLQINERLKSIKFGRILLMSYFFFILLFLAWKNRQIKSCFLFLVYLYTGVRLIQAELVEHIFSMAAVSVFLLMGQFNTSSIESLVSKSTLKVDFKLIFNFFASRVSRVIKFWFCLHKKGKFQTEINSIFEKSTVR